jgi:hypothetical protein
VLLPGQSHQVIEYVCQSRTDLLSKRDTRQRSVDFTIARNFAFIKP